MPSKELIEKAEVRFMPIHSGDGYGYGGGSVLCIGRFAIPFGEHPDAANLALEIARRWNAASALGEQSK
ncbi:MAG TPA: hypothetical protein DD739_10560 [Ochrobactrum anthropi]|nr:hypothetical protein [Brucella anthropi]